MYARKISIGLLLVLFCTLGMQGIAAAYTMPDTEGRGNMLRMKERHVLLPKGEIVEYTYNDLFRYDQQLDSEAAAAMVKLIEESAWYAISNKKDWEKFNSRYEKELYYAHKNALGLQMQFRTENIRGSWSITLRPFDNGIVYLYAEDDKTHELTSYICCSPDISILLKEQANWTIIGSDELQNIEYIEITNRYGAQWIRLDNEDQKLILDLANDSNIVVQEEMHDIYPMRLVMQDGMIVEGALDRCCNNNFAIENQVYAANKELHDLMEKLVKEFSELHDE